MTAVLALILALSFTSGCAGSRPAWNSRDVLRPPADAPDHFQVFAPPDVVDPKPGDGCRGRVLDPRDGTRPILVRSVPGLGDYEVPAGRYGIKNPRRELLRVDCGTGKAVGIVRR